MLKLFFTCFKVWESKKKQQYGKVFSQIFSPLCCYFFFTELNTHVHIRKHDVQKSSKVCFSSFATCLKNSLKKKKISCINFSLLVCVVNVKSAAPSIAENLRVFVIWGWTKECGGVTRYKTCNNYQLNNIVIITLIIITIIIIIMVIIKINKRLILKFYK